MGGSSQRATEATQLSAHITPLHLSLSPTPSSPDQTPLARLEGREKVEPPSSLVRFLSLPPVAPGRAIRSAAGGGGEGGEERRSSGGTKQCILPSFERT